LIRHFVADQYAKNVFEIDLKELQSLGKKVIFTDLDNTLVGSKVLHPTPEIMAFIDDAKKLGFEILIMSNNNFQRVALFSKDLDITAHHKALKPLKLKMARILKQYKRDEVVMIGDQLMTDVLVAKRLGLYTILVEPIELKQDEKRTKINRQLEKIVVRSLRKRNLPVPPHLK